MSLLKSHIFCLLLSVAVWTRTGRLQWGHRGRIVGLSDAKNRLVIGKNIMTTHPERPSPHIHNTCLAAADHDVSLSAGRLHKHSRWGSGSCRPTVTVPLRILTSGRQSTKHVIVRNVWPKSCVPTPPPGVPRHGCGIRLLFTEAKPQLKHFAPAVLLGAHQPWHREHW